MSRTRGHQHISGRLAQAPGPPLGSDVVIYYDEPAACEIRRGVWRAYVARWEVERWPYRARKAHRYCLTTLVLTHRGEVVRSEGWGKALKAGARAELQRWIELACSPAVGRAATMWAWKLYRRVGLRLELRELSEGELDAMIDILAAGGGPPATPAHP